jgi:glycosyltransferase involved in cell wall biosynthesis
MNLGLIIYGSLDILSGGYLYDRKLVEYLRAQGDSVEVIPLPWRNYAAHLTDNLSFRLPRGLDLVIEDELNHPSLMTANRKPHPCPVVSLVHHLRSSELRPAWQNRFYRFVEKRYLQSVDGFIFNSQTTQKVVNRLIGNGKPSIVAYPPTDRFGDALSEADIKERARKQPFRILFLGNVIHRKGVHTLLQALELLNRAGSKGAQDELLFELDVVGSLNSDPAYAKAMQSLATRHPSPATRHPSPATRHPSPATRPSSLVTFHSSLDREPLIDKLKSAHILVVPSSYEGFGIVYLEGMAFGLPAIGTTAGAAGEIISDGQDGYLIAPEDAQTLAARLESLARNRELLVRLSLNALQRYRSQPKWNETAGRIRGFLEGLL